MINSQFQLSDSIITVTIILFFYPSIELQNLPSNMKTLDCVVKEKI